MANKKKKRTAPAKQPVVSRPKEFLDLIAPAAVKFNTDHYILGGSYRCVMVLRSYPPSTEELALLRRLGELGGVTLHLAARQVTAAEENAILHAATNKTRMERSNLSNMKQSVTAEAKLQDVVTLITNLRREQEPLLHCSVFIELAASSQEQLRALRDQVNAWLIRSKLGSDPLLLRQRDGFLSVNPAGQNVFGSFAERVLPASSVANLYPMSYSGKTDPGGFYLGKEKFGSNIIVDLDRRTGDKTNANVLILGNSGQGKSYLLKFLLCNVLEAGKSVMRRVFAYLVKQRHIDRGIIAHFAKAKTLFEDVKYHNCVFVGTDEQGVPRHAHKRSCNSVGKAFRQNIEGSDPRYSFHHIGTDGQLFVFEAPIDLLSYITINPEDWQSHSYVACCGTSAIPVLSILERISAPKEVYLCLDNDQAGETGSLRMAEKIAEQFNIASDRLLPHRKDWNDDLCAKNQEQAQAAMSMEMQV